jgi:hypothetical protein
MVTCIGVVAETFSDGAMIGAKAGLGRVVLDET